MQASRRKFFITSAAVVSSIVLSAQTRADTTAVSESDPTAKALNYKPLASSVDPAKSPTYKAGQMCANCQLYQGTAGSSMGPCAIFGGKQVSAKGWCTAYVKKA
ncbi:high-potential iron-sulfur protein [Pararobbsia alpina]|uniref:High-potential iron-sulfur protein n=1 Tax=Pararobbsia alpina TaxID=621374 RepID=A0A6S7BTI2_9BURK|nr:high-potential iron-sulfur protein [Pararobbsia alpina]CAB3802061.1 hypothetical protein LMG28138_05123 [Pararobbsia alpina]